MMKRRDIIKVLAAAPAGILSLSADEPSENNNAMGESRLIEASFQKVSVGKDDVIILMTDCLLSEKAYVYLKENLKPFFPDQKVLILENGFKIGVIAKAEG